MSRIEKIGPATLILGDCRDILPTLSGVGALVMDPPYGMAYKSGYATDALWAAGKTIAGDESTEARDAALAWAGDLPTLCFGTWRIARPAATKMVLIWDKGGALGMGDLSIPWKPDHEEIYVLGKGFIGSRDSGSVIRHPPVQSMAKNGRLHPTEKPVGLMKKLIAKVPGTILDPFMGSGSTGVAALLEGREFIGIEREEVFFEIACRRLREVAGDDAGPLFVDAGAA
jgi:DNA modification methylase